MFVFQVFKEFKPKHVLQMKSSQAPEKVPLFNKFIFYYLNPRPSFPIPRFFSIGIEF